MAQKPNKTSGAKVSNIMGLLRGNFDFKLDDPKPIKPVAYGTSELISAERRTQILGRALQVVDPSIGRHTSAGALMQMVQSSMSHVGNERLENRKILQLMPEVDKAARLMVASIFSPNDLARNEIDVAFDCDDINDSVKLRLAEKATSFFQKKLNLKTQAASWVYQFGYETGSAVFAIIPLQSFEKIQDASYLGTEAFVKTIVEPLCQDSLFGFGDTSVSRREDIAGLESFTNTLLLSENSSEDKIFPNDAVPNGISKALVSKFIAQEALSLTDNPAVLQVNQVSRDRGKKRTADILNGRFKTPLAQTIVSVDSERTPDGKNKGGVIGNPIMMRLPPESVTIIHTPGDPNDHQGYLILLDQTGSPISALKQEEAAQANGVNYNSQQASIFNQVYSAYGLNTNSAGQNTAMMNRIYTQVVTEHLRNRLGKAGFNHAEMGNLDSVFRCMFGRFMQQKQTRILFLPKDLVTYMTFEMDEHGRGISRLDGIKFNLGMKMAVQVSRVLASIKAAMDKRRIEVKFTENMMENPEAIFQSIIQQYNAKSMVSFSIDPNVVQSQIADKSLSIKGTDIPGMETFDIINEPDTRSAPVDFDPQILEYLDKGINNGMRVPAAAMNSLDENEYARSVTTTNLFFSMDVSIDQDVVIKHVSDLLRKYAKYSEEFQKILQEVIPSLGYDAKGDNSSTDEATSGKTKKDNEDEDSNIPSHYTIDKIIDLMSISLPKPNVAPSKAQFESLDAMVTSITSTVNALLPDELVGPNDTLRPVLAMLRTKLIGDNIRDYLNGSGMGGLDVPSTNFSSQLKDMDQLTKALYNMDAMIKDIAKQTAPVEPTDTSIPGY